jgi:hypothetical protein
LVVFAILLGFIVGGSPSTARNQGFDTQRADDLRSIASCVANFGGNEKRLPEALLELSQSGQYAHCSGNMFDPETGTPYEYRVTIPSAPSGGVRNGEFELCANFTLDSAKSPSRQGAYSSPFDKWSEHGAGRSCDTEKANLERFLDSPLPAAVPPAQTKGY